MESIPILKGSRPPIALLCMLLALLTLWVYWPVQDYGFAGLDDDLYVTGNRKVLSGLTWEGVIWAFSFNEEAYWHPLTWISHMLDAEVFGLQPRGHHLHNLALHVFNGLLLFLLLCRLTGRPWQSAGVALLFGLHPLNVESVVWIASRKNLLSTLFWLLTLWAYAVYVKRPGWPTYLAVLVLLALGLMAKPTLVALPVVLFFLDYWPLRRLLSTPEPFHSTLASSPDRVTGGVPPVARVMLEKLPLIMLALCSVIISSLTAESRSILVSVQEVPLFLRFENALVSYVIYLWKMIWPAPLALFYPYPHFVPAWQTAGAAVLLVAATAGVTAWARRAPFLIVGWAWYVVSLLPVLGLVQQGLWPAWADRFAYIPLIGPFIMFAWGIPAWISNGHRLRRILYVLSPLLIIALAWGTRHQARYWQNNETLFTHAAQVAPPNHLAHYNLGALLLSQGRVTEAILHYESALKIMPLNPAFHWGMGSALIKANRYKEAAYHLEEAVRILPGYAEAHTNLGQVLGRLGETEQAVHHLRKALAIRPIAEAHHNLGLILAGQGHFQEATVHYRQALQIRPTDARIHNDLAVALFSLGERQEALWQLTEAVKLNPADPKLRHNLLLIQQALEAPPTSEDSRRDAQPQVPK